MRDSSRSRGMDLVAIARVARPRGIKGEVAAAVLTDFPERFDGLIDVTALRPDGYKRELKIENHWFQSGRMVLKFEGIDSIEAAEELRDADICIAEMDAVELQSGEFYDWQLEGCKVETTGGTKIGIVRGLMRTTGTENLIIDGDNKEYLIPFAEAICVEVDIESKLIRIDPPEGLLEF